MRGPPALSAEKAACPTACPPSFRLRGGRLGRGHFGLFRAGEVRGFQVLVDAHHFGVLVLCVAPPRCRHLPNPLVAANPLLAWDPAAQQNGGETHGVDPTSTTPSSGEPKGPGLPATCGWRLGSKPASSACSDYGKCFQGTPCCTMPPHVCISDAILVDVQRLKLMAQT